MWDFWIALGCNGWGGDQGDQLWRFTLGCMDSV